MLSPFERLIRIAVLVVSEADDNNVEDRIKHMLVIICCAEYAL